MELKEEMIYTCSCCEYVELVDFPGVPAYRCTIKNVFMYPASKQCDSFDLKENLKDDPFYNQGCWENNRK